MHVKRVNERISAHASETDRSGKNKDCFCDEMFSVTESIAA